jgi:hypothetical protein
LRVVVDVVHSSQPGHLPQNRIVRASNPAQEFSDRQSDSHQNPVKNVENQHSEERGEGEHQLAIAEGGQPPETRHIH